MKRGIFVDLFYAVVIGSAVPAIIVEGDLYSSIFKFILIVIVLEDWFMYYTTIIDFYKEVRDFKFKSLMFEFSILASWNFSFSYYGKDTFLFLLFFGLFFFIRFLAGMSFYNLIRQKEKWRWGREYTLLLPALGSLLIILFGIESLTKELISIILIMVWGIYTLLWWKVFDKKKSQSI